MRERRADIEAAKGLAIVLVVCGHIVARQDPAGVQWYEPLRRAIYAFHMPLFLYLSGYVAACSGFLRRPRAEFAPLAAARARRLLIPFFAMGVLVVLGKLALTPFLYVDHVPRGLGAGLVALIWDTGNSPALFIWYLFVLFVLSLGSLLLLNGRIARLPWLLAAALALYWLPWPEYLYLDRVMRYAPFFLTGALCGFAGARWEHWLARSWPWAMALFAALLGLVAWRPEATAAEKLLLLVVGGISLPAIHGFLRRMNSYWLQNGLVRLGRYCFMIYLFNTLFIGLTKALLLQVWPWDAAYFPAFALVLLSAGLTGPVGLKRYALRRLPWADRMTD